MEATSARLLAVTAVAPVAWGSTYWVTRQHLPADLPLTSSAVRALPAGLLLLLVARRLPHGSWWWRALLVSVLTVSGFFVLVFVAGQRLPSGVAATLMASSAVVVLVLARLLLDERPGARTWAGAVAGVGGVALLVGGASGALDPLGLAASAGAAVSASLGFVLVKRWRPPVPPLAFAAWQLVLGGLVLTPLALLVEGPPPAVDPTTGLALGYVSLVATALAYVAWYAGLARLPAGTVGLVGLLNPVSGTLLGVLVAGEALSPAQLVGGAAVLGGVAVGATARAPAASTPSAGPDVARAAAPQRPAPARRPAA